MATEVKVLADTISPAGKRITTFVLKYPRYIHSEELRHRSLSRNCSSSRATPISKVIHQVIHDPVVPLHFGANQKGMSAQQELRGWRRWLARRLWLGSRWPAVGFAWVMSKVGLHKQVSNRLLETWSYIHVVLTATEWDNFYSLRCDRDHVHPDLYNLAELMLKAHNESKPVESRLHLPYITPEERIQHYQDPTLLFKLSVARCCRVSYLNHDQTSPNQTKDLELYAQLLQNGHMSPFEHQAEALDELTTASGNFKGWAQYRKTLPNEERRSYLRLRRPK